MQKLYRTRRRKTVIGGEIVINGKITVSDGGEIAGFTGIAGSNC